MRYLLMILVFFSVNAFAGARFTMQGNHFDHAKGELFPLVGLSLDQKIWGDNLHVNGWGGFGQRPTEAGDKDWMSYKIGLDYYIHGIMVGAGMFQNFGFADGVMLDGSETGEYMKMSFKLW